MENGNESARSTADGQATTPDASEFGAGPGRLNKQPLREAQNEFVRRYVTAALQLHEGRMTRTAEYLDITREGLYKLRKRLNI